jgi:hypothetical protein
MVLKIRVKKNKRKGREGKKQILNFKQDSYSLIIKISNLGKR